MVSESILLLGTAASIGFIHTLLGPDHYLPFIAISKARNWSQRKTILLTIICGLGHVLGSIFLGLAGIIAGVTLLKLEIIESVRGSIAAWLLFGFGIAYMVWGVHQALKNRPHSHVHIHEDGNIHNHNHGHSKEHAHIHSDNQKTITPWVLFTIFILGPCEPLIPLLMYPASQANWILVVMISLIFSIATITTMTAMVYFSTLGLSKIMFKQFERYTHVLAGFVITLSAGGMIFLGL